MTRSAICGPTPPGRGPGIVTSVLLACLWLGAARAADTPPAPDTSAMEPQVARAIGDARRALLAQPGSADAWGGYGRTLHAHGLREEAAPCYREAARLAPEEPRWPYLLALAVEDDAAEALRQARRAIELDPGYAAAHVLAGRLEEQRGNRQAAASDYRGALVADPRCASAEFGLGRLLLAEGDTAGALRHLERARSMLPGSGSIMAVLARAYQRAGRRDDAERAARAAASRPDEVALDDPLRRWLEDASVSTSGIEKRAARADAAGDLATAESLYRRLVSLRPDDARAHFNLGFTLYRAGRVESSVASLRRAVDLNPGLARAHLILGSILLGGGQVTEGLRHLEPPTLTAEHAEFFVDLGSALLEDGHLEVASYLLGKAVGLDPASPDAHQIFGRLLARRGKFLEAVAQYETAMALDPWAGGVHVDLAMALAGMGRHADAWKQIHAAESKGTKPPADFLGWLRGQMPEPAPGN